MSCTLKRLKPIILIQAESILCIEFPFQETKENFILEECHFDLSVLLSFWRQNRLQAVLRQNEFVLKLDLGAKWDFVQMTQRSYNGMGSCECGLVGWNYQAGLDL